MKKISSFAMLVAAVLASGVLLAQNGPFTGTWKLNTAKSKFNPGPAPQTQTRTVEAQGNGEKVTVEETAADGSRIAYGYTANFDGMDNPESGTGVPYGAATIALKRIDPNTIEGSTKKAGKVLATARNVVSKDGKVNTVTTKGTNANGQPMNNVLVYDKQ